MPSLENLTTEQLQESTKLLHTLLNSPDTREATLRLIKKKNGVPIPEIDAKDAVLAELEKLREETRQYQSKQQEREITERIEKERAKVRSAHQLSDADLLEVEKLMTDKDAPIPSYAAAVKVYQASKKIAEPSTHQIDSSIFTMPEKDVWGPGIGNKMMLDRIAIQEARKAQNEFRSNAMKP